MNEFDTLANAAEFPSALSTAEEAALAAAVRDTLAAAAQNHQPLPLEPDLWQRGRRDGRRHLLQVVAASVVLLATLLGLARFTLPEVLPADAPNGGALPRVVHEPFHDVRPEAERGVGRVSVALSLEGGGVLLVGAEDGAHHVVDLPEQDISSDVSPVGGGAWLSPDGWRLAYPYLETTAPGSWESGLAVVDLRDGGVVREPLSPAGPNGRRVVALGWAPDSDALAWAAVDFASDTTSEKITTVGSGTADAPVQASGPSSSGTHAYGASVALSASGELALTSDQAVSLHTLVPDAGGSPPRWEEETRRTVTVPGTSEDETAGLISATFTSDGARLAVGLEGSLFEDAGTTGELLLADLRSGSGPVEVIGLRAWAVPGADQRGVRLLGATPDGALLVTPDGMGGSDNTWVARIDAGRDHGGDEQKVVRLALTNSVNAVTLATDLGDREPVDFPTPPWARDTTLVRWLVVAALAAAVALALIVRRRTAQRRFLRTGGPAGSAARSVAAIAIVGAVLAVVLWPMRPYQPNAEFAHGVLPSTVSAPDRGLYTYMASSRGVHPTFGSGPLSALATNGSSVLVGVDARDGQHRLFAAPADDPLLFWDDQRQSAVLSPTGTMLASPWVDLGATTAETRSGLRIHDLVTGKQSDVALTGTHGKPVLVTFMSWSPDGSHVAWVGDEYTQLDEGGSGSGGAARTVGVTASDVLDSTSWRVAKAADARAIAATDDGTAHLVLGRRLLTFRSQSPGEPPTSRRITETEQGWTAAVVSPDGRQLLIGTSSSAWTGSLEGGLRVLDLTDPDGQLGFHPWFGAARTESVAPYGWTRDGDLVMALHEEGGGYVQATRVGMLVEQDAQWQFVERTVVDNSGPNSISIATHLADQPSHSFGRQHWPASDERIVLAVGVGLLLALLVAVAVLRRYWPRREHAA